MVVLKIRSLQVLVKKPLAGCSLESIVPIGFLLGEDGEWVVTEWMETELAKEGNLTNALASLMTNQAFRTELKDFLSGQGWQQKLGLQLAYEHLILPEGLPVTEGELDLVPESGSIAFHEDNWIRYQEMVFRVPMEGKESTITSWRFDSGGPGPITLRCVGRCYCQRPVENHYHLSDGHNEY